MEGKSAEEESIVAKVHKFFFDDDSFINQLEAFAREHCHVIDLSAPDTEHRLEYTRVYNEFQRLFERILADYIRSQGSSVQEFYAEVREAHERDEGSWESLVGQILVATADYEVFIQMMREMAMQMKGESKAAEGPADEAKQGGK